jgi:hypothetical protein
LMAFHLRQFGQILALRRQAILLALRHPRMYPSRQITLRFSAPSGLRS